MAAKITFFPVGNGDMTLLELESGRTVLIDINTRAAADDQSRSEGLAASGGTGYKAKQQGLSPTTTR